MQMSRQGAMLARAYYAAADMKRFALRALLPITAIPDPWRVRGYTHCWLPRLRALQAHVARVTEHGIAGAVVECGVAKGGSAAVLALAIRRYGERPLWLFDTFEGLPPPSARDAAHAESLIGACAGSIREVSALFARLHLSAPTCIPGLFQTTLTRTDTGPIAVLHIDGDWYESVVCCLNVLWPRVALGGVVQIDDYGYWQGCRDAVHDYFGSALPRLHRIDRDAIWIEKA
jgi:O-methyltransferase